jgi:hypothetical protein
MRTAIRTGTCIGAIFLAAAIPAFADPGAGKPSPALKAGDGIVYNAGGCPAGQMRQYNDGGAGPGSNCGAFDFDAAVIAEVHKKPKHNLHWVCAVPFASCDAGGASRSMEIAE